MVALLSDIHGNLPALREVLSAADTLGCARFISLGDVTGYFAQPGECIEELRQRNVRSLLGNHDRYLTTGTSCPRSKTVSDLIVYQRSAVSADQLKYLSGLPLSIREAGCFFVHGGWTDYVDEYIYSVSESMLPGDDELYFSGHTHVQVLARFQKKTYCNPGSVGQPRDGDCRAAFAVLNGKDITLHRVEYDIDETVQAMKNAGFPARIYECLYQGAQIGGRIDTVVVE